MSTNFASKYLSPHSISLLLGVLLSFRKQFFSEFSHHHFTFHACESMLACTSYYCGLDNEGGVPPIFVSANTLTSSLPLTVTKSLSPPLVFWVTETTSSGHNYANARNVVITTIMKMKYYVSKVKTYGSSYCTTAFVLMSKLVIETSRFLKTIKCFYLQIARSLSVKLVSLHVGKVTQRFPMTYNI